MNSKFVLMKQKYSKNLNKKLVKIVKLKISSKKNFKISIFKYKKDCF